MKTTLNEIKCPHCKTSNTWTPENRFRPFCSERCRLIDLGGWASEMNRLPTNEESNSSEQDQDTP